MFALRRESTVAIGNHPLTIVDRVEGEARNVDLCARGVDAAATLDRVYVQAADPGVVQFLSPAM